MTLKVLCKNGSSCAAIGLPSPQGETTDDDTSLPNEPPPTFDDLTEEQQDLAENVLCSVSSDQEEAVPNLHYVREDLRLQQAHLIPQASQQKGGMCDMDRNSHHSHDTGTDSARPFQVTSPSA